MGVKKKIALTVPKPSRTALPPEAAQSFEAGPQEVEPAPKPRASEAELTVTTFRITRAQHQALRQAALEVAAEQGGKADASAVLRALLEQWRTNGSPLP